MTGTVVITEQLHSPLAEIKWAWTSTNPGELAGDVTTNAYSGQIAECLIIPGTAAVTPSDLYDVVITDANGVDVLHGLGADCSATDTMVLMPGLGAVANSVLTLAVSNAGAAKSGTVILHLSE